ncbi:hypothetical protein KJI95_00880 [Shewanella sp. JM162201]|uniref:Uncharacterized protein n=1 Tax=Shewanella jiangmenensis TaxID=2837387 RepID=A0ABS5UYA7_9GAMM|nr:hypothetical protein [Shewanella jiangmenensis]MBT1443082.1 hypothetical protein [Shewanella jiangmenensis]
MKMDYLKNIELAVSLGFEEVPDENAYKGRYYIKNGIIWIHDIGALKHKLGDISDQELAALGYDVDSYYKYVDFSNEMVDKEIERISTLIQIPDSVLFGRFDILEDSALIKTMASLSDEGFDEEILADFAHQMSKD